MDNYKENIIKLSESRLKRLYGLTNQDYYNLLAKQGGKCAICEVSQHEMRRPFYVDHNHKDGKIRGLLCAKCNVRLVTIENHKEITVRMIDYLNNNGIFE